MVVRFRLLTGNPGLTPVKFRVIHEVGGAFTGAGTSTSFVPAAGLNVVPAQIKVTAGDRVGIDCCTMADLLILAYRPAGPHVAEGSILGWQPVLADGSAPTASNSGDPDYEILVNADVEPDADGDGFGDETQDACPAAAGTAGGCPVPTIANPVPAPTKAKSKCKNAKKKSAAAAKKKKKCKKPKKKG